MKYDYKQAIIKDIKDYIKLNDVLEDARAQEWSKDNLIEHLEDELWDKDEITGNGYDFYDTEDKCSEYICGNFDILYDAMKEYCIDDNVNILINQYEKRSLARYFDCTIRCYLLYECISDIIEELYEEDN